MSSFIRPEARAALWHWRGVLQGAGVILLGLWFFWRFFGLLSWLGLALMLLGAFLTWAGVLRARIRLAKGGPGMVEIVERRVTYFSPVGGNEFSLDDVTRIEVTTTGQGSADMFWLFHLKDGSLARIPAAAAEGDRIIDALTALKGVDYDRIIKASATGATQSSSRECHLIWQKPD